MIEFTFKRRRGTWLEKTHFSSALSSIGTIDWSNLEQQNASAARFQNPITRMHLISDAGLFYIVTIELPVHSWHPSLVSQYIDSSMSQL